MKRFCYVLFILLSFCSAGCGTPKEEVKPLVVAMELQYPPFEMSDEAGNPAGISVEIAKGFAEFAGRPLKIQNTSWAGLIPSLQTKKADFVISSMSITEERKKAVNFSVPYGQSGLTLLLHKDSPANSFEDLDQKNIKVAVKSGTMGAILAQKKLKNADIRSFDDVVACVLEVSQGKADAFIYDPLTIYENHKKHQATTRINISAITGTNIPWGIAVKKENKELLEKLNEYIQLCHKENRFNEISKHYLGEMVSIFEKNNIPFFFDL